MTDGQRLPQGDTCRCQWSQALGTSRGRSPQPRCAAGWLSKRKWLPEPHSRRAQAPLPTDPSTDPRHVGHKPAFVLGSLGLLIGCVNNGSLCLFPEDSEWHAFQCQKKERSWTFQQKPLVTQRPCYASSQWLPTSHHSWPPPWG